MNKVVLKQEVITAMKTKQGRERCEGGVERKGANSPYVLLAEQTAGAKALRWGRLCLGCSKEQQGNPHVRSKPEGKSGRDEVEHRACWLPSCLQSRAQQTFEKSLVVLPPGGCQDTS